MQQEILWGPVNGLLRSWKIQPGSKVLEGDILALVEPSSYKLISPVSGTLLSCLVRNNTKVEAKQVVCVISTCKHPILTITDVCTTCHVNLHETSEYAFYITPSNHPIKRRVADVEAESLAKKRALLASRRLVLVLDLDQTVLHAALLNGYEGSLACELDPPTKDVFAFELSGRSRMVVKFRPGLRDFLLAAHQLYEIHVYTMANAEYAAKIVELINSKILSDVEPLLRQQIIGTRIITRSHTEDSYEMQLKQQGGAAYVMKLREKRKDIKHIVGDSSIAVILDDSDGVWPEYLNHLIQIFPFVYWPNQEDLNKTFHARLPSPSSTPQSSSTSPSTSSIQSNLIASSSSMDATSTSPSDEPQDPKNNSMPSKKRPSPSSSFSKNKNDAINESRSTYPSMTQSDSEETLEDGVKKRRKNAENSTEDQAAEHKLAMDATENENSAAPLSEDERRILKGAETDMKSNAVSSSSTLSSQPISSPSISPSSLVSLSSPTIDVEPIQSNSNDSLNPTENSYSVSSSNASNASNPSNPSNPSNSSNSSMPSNPSSSGIDPRITPLLLPFGIRYLPSSNQDSLLDSMMTVLKKLHSEFFALPENSKRRQVQLILPRMRQNVLKGRTICLSGVIPHQPKPGGDGGETSNSSNSASAAAIQAQKMLWPEQSKAGMREIVRLEHFGAKYEENISIGNPEHVTHVVSARGSTMKVRNAAQSKSVFCVTKQWLDQSIIHWKAQNESEFPIPEIPLCVGPMPILPSTEDSSIWTQEDLEEDMKQLEEEKQQENLKSENGYHGAAPSSPLSDSYIDLESLLQADYDVSEEAEEED